MEQEKSRATLMTVDRPARSSVFVISRQMVSIRFARIESRSGSKALLCPLSSVETAPIS
jgi:hypothetical protein